MAEGLKSDLSKLGKIKHEKASPRSKKITFSGELLKKEEVTAFCLHPVQSFPGLAESKKIKTSS